MLCIPKSDGLHELVILHSGLMLSISVYLARLSRTGPMARDSLFVSIFVIWVFALYKHKHSHVQE